jgi:hypothetical protein
MTVQELIQELKTCPPEALILLPFNAESFVPLERVDTSAVWKSDSDIFPFTYVTNISDISDGYEAHSAGKGKMAVCLVPNRLD